MEDRKLGSYCLIRNTENKIAIIKYNNGFCLPGGGVKDGENIEDALIRELKEELNYTVQKEEILLIKDFYSFIMPENIRKGKPAHEENHYYSIITHNGESLQYIENKKDGVLVRINIDELLNDEISPFLELKNFYLEKLIPFYKTLINE